MTDLISSDWKELDADNTQPSPNGVQGGYAPSQVAPIIRSIRGSLKRFYNQANPVYTSTGSATAYVLTFEAAPAGYSKGIVYRFWAHATNTGTATLNINSMGARAIVSGAGGSPLTAGQIISGRMIEVVFNGTAFELLNLGFTPIQPDSVQFKNALYVDNASHRQIIFRNANNVIQNHLIANADDGSLMLRVNDNAGTFIRDFIIPRTGSMTLGGATVWTSANGGLGSGLDADMLDGYQASALPVSTPQQTALNLKANLASPAFTGTPTAPTQTQGNNSTRLATTAYVDTGLSGQVTKAGDTMTGALGVTAARGTGATTNALVAVRNTQNGDAIITMGANNRTTGLSTFGQRANGSSFISTDTQTWALNTSGDIGLPNGGILYGNGEIYHGAYATTMSSIIDRSRKIRLSREQYQSVNVNGWNNVPAGAVITGLYRGGNGQIEGMNYRYLHQTDINGTWQFAALE